MTAGRWQAHAVRQRTAWTRCALCFAQLPPASPPTRLIPGSCSDMWSLAALGPRQGCVPAQQGAAQSPAVGLAVAGLQALHCADGGAQLGGRRSVGPLLACSPLAGACLQQGRGVDDGVYWWGASAARHLVSVCLGITLCQCVFGGALGARGSVCQAGAKRWCHGCTLHTCLSLSRRTLAGASYC